MCELLDAMSLKESTVVDAALTWSDEPGYAVGHGPHLAPGEPATERASFGEVVLVGRLREAIRRLNQATGILSEQFLAEVRGLKHKNVAAELISQVRKSVSIDWTLRESARARIRVLVKRILNKYGYPPDLQEEAVKTVLQQAELLCAEWA
jgi:hypothetical protein